MFGSHGVGGLKVGEVYAAAGVRVDESGFREWDRRYDKVQRDARQPVTGHGRFRGDNSGFDRFDHRMAASARTTERHSGRIRGALRGIASTATWVGTAGIGFLGVKTVGVASDIAESTTKIEQLFGRQAQRIQRFSQRSVDAIGLSRAAALEAAGDYGSLFQTIGEGDKEAAKMSLRLVRLAQDLASFNNANPDEVLLALKSGLIGEAEPMRRFGALLSETRVQQEAWSTGIAKGGAELNEQQKVQARYQLILKDTAAASGDYRRTSDGLANSQRRLGARFEDIGGRIGQKLIPFVLSLTTGIDDLLKQMEKGQGTGGKLGEILSDVGDAAKDAWPKIRGVGEAVIDFVSEHPEISKAAVALAATALALKGIGAVSRATPLGRGIGMLTAAVAGAAVVHAAHAVASRGGILGKLAAGFLAPGSTPARPLFVKEINPFRGAPGVGVPGAPGAPGGGGGGKLGKAGSIGRVALMVGGRSLGWIGVALTVGSIATGMDLTTEDEALINRRTGRGARRPRGDVMPGFVGDPRTTGGGQQPGDREAEHASRAMVQSERAATRLQRKMKDVARAIWQMSADSRISLKDLERDSARNFERIKDDIGLKTDQGRAAATRNFRATATAIARAMQDGRADTKSGMAAIERLATKHAQGAKNGVAQNMDAAANAIRRTMRRGGTVTDQGMKLIRELMIKELRMYGLSERDAIASANVRTGEVPGGTRRQDFAAGGLVSPGGWFGRAGEKGRDLVHAVVGRGEAILNHAQQKVVNRALAMAGIPRGLHDVFRMTKGTKHYLAGGGVAGAIAAANRLENAHFPYRWGGGHQGSPAPFGPMDCSGAVSYVLQAAGIKIPTMVSGALANAGRPGRGPLTVFADAGHTLMSILGRFFGTSGTNPGGGAGWIDPPPDPGYLSRFAVRHFGPGDMTGGSLGQIARIIVKGNRSPLRRSVQGAVDLGTAGAQSRLDALSKTVFGGGDPGDSTLSSRQVMDLWQDEGGRAALATIMDSIAYRESRRNPSAVGGPNDDGTYDHGLYQINDIWRRDSVVGRLWSNILDARANTRGAIRIEGTSGLGAWSSSAAAGGIMGLPTIYAAGGHPGNQAIIEPDPGSIDSYVGPHGFLTGAGGRYSARAARVISGLQKAIATAGRIYELKNRRFDLTEEELIDEGDEDTPPSYNDAAIRQRAGELYTLMGIRGGQAKDYGRILRYLNRLQQVYSTQRGRLGTIVEGIQRRLSGLPEKGGSQEQRRSRKTLLERLERYRNALKVVGQRLGGVRTGIQESGFERESTLIDVAELRKEFAPLARHAFGLPGGLELPEWSAPDTATDSPTGEEDPDVAARLESERTRADRAEAALRGTAGAFNVFGGPGDIGQGGRDAYGAVTAPTGQVGGGSRYMDPATGKITEYPAGGGITIIQQMLTPGDPKQLKQAAGAVAEGFGLQPYTGSSKTEVNV